MKHAAIKFTQIASDAIANSVVATVQESTDLGLLLEIFDNKKLLVLIAAVSAIAIFFLANDHVARTVLSFALGLKARAIAYFAAHTGKLLLKEVVKRLGAIA